MELERNNHQKKSLQTIKKTNNKNNKKEKEQTKMTDISLYERIGGKDAVDVAVEKFYEKVLKDPLLIPFFVNTDMNRQIRMQKLFLTYAFGGSKQWSGKNMRAAHTKTVEKGLSDQHFDAVVGHLATTLKELGVKPEDIQEVARIAETIRADVLNK